MKPEFIVALVIGSAALVEAFLIRAGRMQKWPRRYYAARDAPYYVRYGFFGLVPFGMMIFLWLAAIPVGRLGGAWGYVAIFLFLLGAASFVLAFRWMKHPPEWLKPEWMRAEERGERAESGISYGDEGPRLVEISRTQYLLGWLVVAGIFVLWLVLDWPASILIGAGIGMIILAASRPRSVKQRREREHT